MTARRPFEGVARATLILLMAFMHFSSSTTAQLCAPLARASWRVSDQNAATVAFDGMRFVYVADHPDDLDPMVGALTQFWDMSDMNAPVMYAESSLAFDEDFLEFAEPNLWLVYEGGFATVVDVSDPANIPDYRDFEEDDFAYVSFQLASGERIQDFDVRGNLALIVTRSHIRVFDVSDLANVTQVTAVDYRPMPSGSGFARILGNRVLGLFPGLPETRFTLWDISEPANPTMIANSTLLGDVSTPFRLENNILAAFGIPGGQQGGLGFFDLSDPNNTDFLGVLPGFVRGFLRDDLVYRLTLGCSLSFSVFDVSDPSEIELIGTSDVLGNAVGVNLIIEDFGEAVLLRRPLNGEAELIFVTTSDCDTGDFEFNVVVSSHIEISPDDTSIRGVPLNEARILVSSVGLVPPGSPPPCLPPTPASLTIRGDHEIPLLVATDGSVVIVDGRLEVGEIELTNGAILRHSDAAVTEFAQPKAQNWSDGP